MQKALTTIKKVSFCSDVTISKGRSRRVV